MDLQFSVVRVELKFSVVIIEVWKELGVGL